MYVCMYVCLSILIRQLTNRPHGYACYPPGVLSSFDTEMILAVLAVLLLIRSFHDFGTRNL